MRFRRTSLVRSKRDKRRCNFSRRSCLINRSRRPEDDVDRCDDNIYIFELGEYSGVEFLMMIPPFVDVVMVFLFIRSWNSG